MAGMVSGAKNDVNNNATTGTITGSLMPLHASDDDDNGDNCLLDTMVAARCRCYDRHSSTRRL